MKSLTLIVGLSILVFLSGNYVEARGWGGRSDVVADFDPAFPALWLSTVASKYI